MKKSLVHVYTFGIVSLCMLPALAYAAQDAFMVAYKIVGEINLIVGTLIPVVFSLAILAFFYGIMVYVFSKSGDGKISGRNVMLWSLIAIFIMVSLSGIIALVQSTLGIDGSSNFAPSVPTI